MNQPLSTSSPDFIALRRRIHAEPELRFEEIKTAALVAQTLRAAGCDEVVEGLGKTGVVGRIRGARPLAPGAARRMIGLRADMDALPITEKNTFAHASTVAGRMHACGHDGHTATLLAAAHALAQSRDFAGDVVVIFQPAEEGGAGAREMIRDGLFERFPVDEVYGLHNWPGLAEGVFGFNPGPLLASSNTFEVKVVGKGAHAAMPHLGVDPVVVASQLVLALQTVVSRSNRPIDAVALSVTKIQAGEAINVIPNHCTIQGTVRTFSLEALDLTEASMRRICEQLPVAFGATAKLQFSREYPPTVNHAEQTQAAAEVARSLFGSDRVVMPIDPTMGAEDFAFMLLEKPGCYFFLGNGDLGGDHRESGHGLGPCALHNPSYDFNDRLIEIGQRFWPALVRARLG